MARTIGGGGNAYVQSKILNALRQAEGGLVSPDELIKAVWGEIAFRLSNPLSNIGVAIFYLRKRGFPIHTAHRRGYRFVPEGTPEDLHYVYQREIRPRRAPLRRLIVEILTSLQGGIIRADHLAARIYDGTYVTPLFPKKNIASVISCLRASGVNIIMYGKRGYSMPIGTPQVSRSASQVRLSTRQSPGLPATLAPEPLQPSASVAAE